MAQPRTSTRKGVNLEKAQNHATGIRACRLNSRQHTASFQFKPARRCCGTKYLRRLQLHDDGCCARVGGAPPRKVQLVQDHSRPQRLGVRVLGAPVPTGRPQWLSCLHVIDSSSHVCIGHATRLVVCHCPVQELRHLHSQGPKWVAPCYDQELLRAGWTAAAVQCCKQQRLWQLECFATCLELSASTMTAAAEDTDTSRRSVMSSGLPCRNTKLLPWRWSGGICRLPHETQTLVDTCKRPGVTDAGG